MNTKVNAQVLTYSELEQVAGGTVGELDDLFSAITSQTNLKCLSTDLSTHFPGANAGTREVVSYILKKYYHINANISIGYLGLGISSDPNTYTDMNTGNPLTHQEVLARIRG